MGRHRLTDEERAARAAARAAEQQAQMDAWVAEQVAKAPPLTPEKAARIARLLLGDRRP